MNVDEFIKKGFLDETTKRIPYGLIEGGEVSKIEVRTSDSDGGNRMEIFFIEPQNLVKASVIFNDGKCSFVAFVGNLIYNSSLISAVLNEELSEFLTKLYTGL